MNSPKHIILLSTLVLFIISGCAKINEDPSIIYNLEEEFVIRPYELLGKSEGNIILEINSLEEEPCDNSEIVYQYRNNGSISVIMLDDITKTENCNTTHIQPSAKIPLSPIGTNALQINVTIKEIIENTGDITEQDDRYIIRMNSSHGIRFSHTELLKVNPSSIWGGADYNSADSAMIAGNFIADVVDIAQPSLINKGYYGHFEKMESGEISVLNRNQLFDHRKTFAFDSEITLEDMQSTIEEYRALYPGIQFYIFNGLGQSL